MDTSRVGITLETHILEGMRGHPEATGAFTALLATISLAAKLISAQVRRAGLANVLGYTGEVNVQGEQVQKLDVLANDTLVALLRRQRHCAAVASEELDEVKVVGAAPSPRYLVVFDPLDGSSNIDVNISIGTIFGVLRRTSPDAQVGEREFLVPGRELVAAGYVLYGSSTQLVITTGQGVDAFTYDPSVGEFFLSQADIRVPERGSTYSINEGNSAYWTPELERWAAWIKADDKPSRRPYGARYVGSLVADAHRTLLRGGIFAYPGDRRSPNGKLRLLYECNPIAFVMEAAGGKASTGRERILDIVPESLHQRVPLVIGSRDDVERFEEFARGGGA